MRVKILLLLFFFSLLFIFVSRASAATGINEQLNFQGKLVNSNGTNVTDGNYNMEFKIYQDGDGVIGGGDETLKWTETRTAGNQVAVNDGVFRVSLGSVTAFSTSIDWNQSVLWLSVNFNGDGEMGPYVRLSAAPYALNAKKVSGLTVTDTTGTLTVSALKTLTVSDSTTLGTNSITLAGGEVITFSATNALSLLTTGTTSVTLPTGGTLLTNTALANQTITSTQTSGTVLGVTDSTALSAAIKGTVITLSGTGAFDQTGLEFNLSGASGTNLNDIVGTGSTWKVTTAGGLYVTSCTGCGGGGGTLQQAYDAGNTITTTNAKNISITLADLATDQVFEITQAGTSLALRVNDDGTFTDSTSFVVDASGNVGIGTTAPAAKLEIVGTADDQQLIVRGNATQTANILEAYSAAGNLTGYFNERGELRVTPDLTSTVALRIKQRGSGQTSHLTDWSNAANTIDFSHVDESGNFRIGETAPDTGFLSVAGTLAIEQDVLYSTLTTATGAGANNAAIHAVLSNAPVNASDVINGVKVTGVAQTVASTTQNLLRLTPASSGNTAGTLNGINIDAITGSTSTETGIKIGTGWDNGLDVASNVNISSTMTATGTTTIGSGGNTFTFNPASGPVYAGTARPSKIIVLSPEYAGATLTVDGSSTTTGSMTSDNLLNAASGGWKNYYQWTSTNASLQDYTVLVMVTLPQDFDAWQTGSCPSSTCALEIAYKTGVTGTTNNTVSVLVNNAATTPGTVVCTIAAASSTTWTSFGCTSTTLATSPTWNTAGAQAAIRIKLAANSTASALAQVGDITLRYSAEY